MLYFNIGVTYMSFLQKIFSPGREEFRARRNKFIDYIEMLCRKTHLSDKNLGTWIRAIHINLPAYLMFGIIFTPQWLATICFITVIVIFLAFIYLKGCWLSLLEKRICNDDINVMDAPLELTGYTLDYEDSITLNMLRYKFSLFGLTIYMPLILGIYYYRFLYK